MDLQIELTGGPIIGTSGYMNSSIGKRININDKSIHTTTLFKKDHVLVESKKVFRDEQQVPIGILKVKIIDHGGIAALRILRISFLGLLVIIIVLSGFMQVWLTRNIISPIGEMGSAAAKLQNKNFSSLINVSTKDEIGDLAASFNGMVQEMNSVIRNMKNRARVVAHHGGSLATISCHMTEASQQVSTAIAETAAGINAQANELIEITNALHHFGHKIHRIVQTVDEIELKSQQLFTSAAQSNKQLQVVEQAFDDVEQLFEQIRIKTEKLYDSVKQVMNISHMIQDISDQTNLLALNAMIEAANSRKGSSGFTVIALEIRKLAEQCKGFSKEIQQIVKLFSDDHKEILDEVQLANVTLTEQADIVRYTLDAIKEITIGVEDIIPCIHEIYSTSQEVRSEQKSVFGRVEEVSAVTQEICASAQEISASAQEMYGAAEEVAASAQVLEQEAKGIKSELDAFILEA
jgi:methyl-accepting chemotaxis protein